MRMNHDHVASAGDKVLNLADLCGRILFASYDSSIISVLVQDLLKLTHNACPVSILDVLDGDADLLAAAFAAAVFAGAVI